MYSSTI